MSLEYFGAIKSNDDPITSSLQNFGCGDSNFDFWEIFQN